MKVEELRIGNWVIDSFNDCFKQIDINDLSVADKYQNLELLTIPYREISINKDWLLKFSFKVLNSISLSFKKYVDNVSKRAFYIKLKNVGNVPEWVVTFVSEDYEFQKTIKSVHQLQNLYFIISDVELLCA